MRTYLMCSSPIHGHVAPVAAVAERLVRRGDAVSILTGRKYEPTVRRVGATFLPLPESVDYDDADLDSWLPDRDRYKGLAGLRRDLIGMFVRPIPEQHRAVQRLLADPTWDAIIAEFAFTGLLPTLHAVPPEDRIPVLGLGIGPLGVAGPEVAPNGMGLQPGRGPLARLRNRVLNTVILDGVFGPVQEAMDAALEESGVPRGQRRFVDAALAYDRTFQLGAAAFEYPRRALPDSFRFVGPLPLEASGMPEPEWWGDLEGRRVVHVTQGTIDNRDLTRLLVPTIRALADEDVLVVAATGGRPVAEVEQHFPEGLPRNTRVAAMLPYDRLLPRTSVMVTNGGYGGTQLALAAGVPLVVAGATEDKPDVAARAAWSGVGVNLRTGKPKPPRIRRGVLRVLGDERYRAAAGRIRADLARLPDPIDVIAAETERLVDATRRDAAPREA
jgi:UDP:flavonoid glycosyltransferase YjiC (YdhE family)